MILNLNECKFRVKGGKCLVFLVDERGNEANPDKTKAMMEMNSPRNIREVQNLIGCLSTLGHFLSWLADKSLYFFEMKKFAWYVKSRAGILLPKNTPINPSQINLPLAGGNVVHLPGRLKIRAQCCFDSRKRRKIRPDLLLKPCLPRSRCEVQGSGKNGLRPSNGKSKAEANQSPHQTTSQEPD